MVESGMATEQSDGEMVGTGTNVEINGSSGMVKSETARVE